MNKKMPYSVPEEYFGNLEERVMDSVTKRPGLWQKMTPALAVAASMLVLLGIGSFIVGKTSGPSARTSLTEDEIIEYLIESHAPLAYFDETF